MKRYAFLITLIFALLLTACTSSAPSPAAAASPVCPEKPAFNAEEQALADRCYEQMKERYPEFAAIPRELMQEWVSLGEYEEASFTFCIGGYKTDYECDYMTGPDAPEGIWELYGEEYAPLADRYLTEDELASLERMLTDSISGYVDEKRLGMEPSAGELHLFWTLEDGRLYANAEEIAYVTDETVGSYGCGGHAHVFARAAVDITGSGAKLTDLGASGS